MTGSPRRWPPIFGSRAGRGKDTVSAGRLTDEELPLPVDDWFNQQGYDTEQSWTSIELSGPTVEPMFRPSLAIGLSSRCRVRLSLVPPDSWRHRWTFSAVSTLGVVG